MPRTDRLSLSQVEPNKYNPNKMKPNQRKALQRVIAKFGFLQPMLVRPVQQEYPGDPEARYVIVDGEHRYDALKERGEAEADFVILDDETSDSDAKLLTLIMNSLRGKPIPLKQAELLVDLEAEIGRDELVAAGFETGELDKAQELAGPVPDDEDQPQTIDEPRTFEVSLMPDQFETVMRAVETAKSVAMTDRDDVALTALAQEFLATYPDHDPETGKG